VTEFGVGCPVVVRDTTHVGYDTCVLIDDFHFAGCSASTALKLFLKS
jgi:hypothetical protein